MRDSHKAFNLSISLFNLSSVLLRADKVEEELGDEVTELAAAAVKTTLLLVFIVNKVALDVSLLLTGCN